MATPSVLDFTAAPSRRRDGWTADKQRDFIAALAETGCVSEACGKVGITPRSAYRLRLRADGKGFAAAWDAAVSAATQRLLALAYERAVHGHPRNVWRGDRVVGTERVPSDRLLMFLLKHLDPMRFGITAGILTAPVPNTRIQATDDLPHLLADLADNDEPTEVPATADVDDIWYEDIDDYPR